MAAIEPFSCMLIDTWTRVHAVLFLWGGRKQTENLQKKKRKEKKRSPGKYLDLKGQSGETGTLHNAELFYLYKSCNCTYNSDVRIGWTCRLI